MKLKEITVELTQQCPNCCIHCSSLSSMTRTCMIPYNKVEEIIDDATELGCTHLNLSGGEPFLRPDLPKIVAHAYKRKMNVSIYTSGIYHDGIEYGALPLKILREILPYNCKIIVNYEARDSETYDLIMGTHIDGFNLLKQSILFCVRMGFNVEAHTVPMAVNYRQIQAIIIQCMTLGVKKVSFLRLVCQGRAKENRSLTALTKEQINEVKRVIYSERQRHPNAIRIGQPLSSCSETLNCLAGSVKLNVRYDGKVFPCEAFKDDNDNNFFSYSPGNIFESNLIDIYNNDVYLAEVRTTLEMYNSVCRKEKCFNQYIRNYGKY